jgi:hypothetical protein
MGNPRKAVDGGDPGGEVAPWTAARQAETQHHTSAPSGGEQTTACSFIFIGKIEADFALSLLSQACRGSPSHAPNGLAHTLAEQSLEAQGQEKQVKIYQLFRYNRGHPRDESSGQLSPGQGWTGLTGAEYART